MLKYPLNSSGLWALLLLVPGVLSAQSPLGAGPQLGLHQAWEWSADPEPVFRAPRAGAEPVGRATVLSAMLPGAGQHVLGQRRKWVYLALEVLGWAMYVDGRSAGLDGREKYRDFAWNQARLQTSPRIDGDFHYYETLTKWERSGDFDVDAIAGAVQPETDPTTFNGSIWSLATQLFLPGGTGVPVGDPQYQRALEYYQQRAFGTDLLWDWTSSGIAQDRFGALIYESDDGFRKATNALGVILANHVVSAVDAYLSARGVLTPSEVRLVPTLGAIGPGWEARVEIAVSR